MTLPSDRSPSTTESIHPGTFQELDGSLPAVDLVFTQDGSGQYLSFYWRDADRYGLRLDQVVGQSVNAAFVPVSIASHLERVRQVLSDLIPLRLEAPFQVANQHLVFELTISPILMPHGTATSVLGMGRFLYAAPQEPQEPAPAIAAESKPENVLLHTDYAEGETAAHRPQTETAAHRYQKRLTELVWKIRRTLDLETIWQQTVEGLGEAFNVSRCLIFPYTPGQDEVWAAAEYCKPELPSLLNRSLSFAQESYLAQALTTLKPIACSSTKIEDNQSSASVVTIATCYQDQPNGLIMLSQIDRSRVWSDIEIDLLREIADQVGTGIAHATLFAESQNLASELQRVNDSLMKKHQELEDARQQAEAASRLKSEFLANTSHELRTPLNGVIGFLKLIMDGMADDPAEQSQFLQEAYGSAIHLLNIINDILDIAKIEAGKMQLELNPIKLDDLLNAVDNFTRPQAQQKGLSFEIRTPVTRDEVILHGNYQRLLQVMLNLVGNAIKFTHEGGLTISAEIISKRSPHSEDKQEKPGMVKISVADTGIGVSLEKQDKLFQSFSQVDGSRTRQYGGTGLGLAISQKLVEAMGGEVNFYSMGEGLGSTVTFTVPLFHDPLMVTAPLPDAADLLL